ncbi:MAG TPA: hypothetical protein VE056_09565 [Pyrinomonadaceae bacterium]|nr:hypothetical protein [Pyrinomonadaceae bacterium]
MPQRKSYGRADWWLITTMQYSWQRVFAACHRTVRNAYGFPFSLAPHFPEAQPQEKKSGAPPGKAQPFRTVLRQSRISPVEFKIKNSIARGAKPPHTSWHPKCKIPFNKKIMIDNSKLNGFKSQWTGSPAPITLEQAITSPQITN